MIRKGFVDLQINGWMGTDFSVPGLTVDQVLQITRDLVARGTIAYCPTLITSPWNYYERNLPVIATAMRDPEWGGHILGIHLEGPFVSPVSGAIGAHPPDCVRKPNIRRFDRLMEWADGKVCILTVAPERPGAIDLIRHARRRGVTVSVGHHLAGDAVLERAVRAGARLFTHLGNGLPNLIHRHHNPLWWSIACDAVTAMIITDGHHIPDDMIQVVLRAKGRDRVLVTSDASSLAGLPPGKYKMGGRLPVVIEKSGRIYSAQTQTLAGSHATMIDCMNHLASLDLLDEKELWQVGVLNPLRAIGLTPARLARLNGPAIAFRNGRFVLHTAGREGKP